MSKFPRHEDPWWIVFVMAAILLIYFVCTLVVGCAFKAGRDTVTLHIDLSGVDMDGTTKVYESKSVKVTVEYKSEDPLPCSHCDDMDPECPGG